MASNDIASIRSSLKMIAKLQVTLAVLVGALALLLLVRIVVAIFSCLCEKKAKKKGHKRISASNPEKVVVIGHLKKKKLNLSKQGNPPKPSVLSNKIVKAPSKSNITQSGKDSTKSTTSSVAARKETGFGKSLTMQDKVTKLDISEKKDVKRTLPIIDGFSNKQTPVFKKDMERLVLIPAVVPMFKCADPVTPPNLPEKSNVVGTKMEWKAGDVMLNQSVMNFIEGMGNGSVIRILENDSDIRTATNFSPDVTEKKVPPVATPVEQNSEDKSSAVQDIVAANAELCSDANEFLRKGTSAILVDCIDEDEN